MEENERVQAEREREGGERGKEWINRGKASKGERNQEREREENGSCQQRPSAV